MADRQVGGAPTRRIDVAPRAVEQRQRQADQARIVGIERVGLAVEGDDAGPGGFGHPLVERLLVLDQLVVGGGEGLVGPGRGRRRRLGIGGLCLLGRCRRRGRRHGAGRFAQLAREALQQALEALQLEPRQQHVGIGLALVEGLGLGGGGHVVPERDQLLRDARQLGVLLQRLAPLGLLDLAGARQQGLEVAILVDQLGGGLDADARDARHVVGRIAGQRLHVDHFVRRDAELLHHRLDPELGLLDRVHQLDARPHELHQVLVGRHDGAGRAGLDGHAGIGCDQVVGFVALELAHRDVEGACRLADQRELRDQVLGRRRAVGLVLVVDLVAERDFAGVEDHGDMVDLGLVQKVGHQHAAEAVDGVDRRAVGPVHRRQRMIGAEQVARAVDQVEVADRRVVAVLAILCALGRRRGGRFLGFRHAQALARAAGRGDP